MHSKYSRSKISINSVFPLANSRKCGSIGWFPVSQFFLALVKSWRHQVLICAHSKCVGSCSMLIQTNMAAAALFFIWSQRCNKTGLHNVHTVAPAIFWLCIEQIWTCWEHPSSNRPQNKNDNVLNDFGA
jgi:hypothetical protein